MTSSKGSLDHVPVVPCSTVRVHVVYTRNTSHMVLNVWKVRFLAADHNQSIRHPSHPGIRGYDINGVSLDQKSSS